MPHGVLTSKRALVRAAFCGIVVAIFLAKTTLAEEPSSLHPGAKIFRQHCMNCHGEKGQGSVEHAPLTGKMQVESLAKYIDEMMPEENPELCQGEDAKQVATYIYDAFYSPVAQARIAPPRVQRSRLTVRQHRHTLADIVGAFRRTDPWHEERHWRIEYFNSGRSINESRKVERSSATKIDLHEHPGINKLDKNEFAVRWDAGVAIPVDGEYEFILKAKNGARLWVNDHETPLIDAWVHSDKHTEHRASVRLLAGHVTQIRLEAFKEKKGKEFSVQLQWKPPGRSEGQIPSEMLSPDDRYAEVYVAQTPFPPDDASTGVQRGVAISSEWDAATTYAAIEAVDYITRRLPDLAGYRPGDSNRGEKLQEFCRKFVERAFRRPLNEEQRNFFISQRFNNAESPEEATKIVMLLALKSPRFLYQETVPTEPDAYDVAARLSYTLWDSIPDETLFRAAAANQLQTQQQVRSQIERMMNDPRTRGKLQDFFAEWLQIEHIADEKNNESYPGYGPELVSDLKRSLDLSLDEICWGDKPDFRRLFTFSDIYLNPRLAEFYGAKKPATDKFEKMAVPNRPAGLLTHPLLLANFSYADASSPIHRGVFVARGVLGRTMRPPPEAVAPLSHAEKPDLTTRERVTLQTNSQACQMCHATINPLGFALENYDAVGRFRENDGTKTIDASGELRLNVGELKKFRGPKELATALIAGEEMHEAFVENLYHYFTKQPLRALAPERTSHLYSSFETHEFDIRRQMVETVLAYALHGAEKTSP